MATATISHVDEVKARLDAHETALKIELEQIRQAKRALGATPMVFAQKARGMNRTTRARRPGRNGSTSDEKIIAELRKHDQGMSAVDLARQTRVSSQTALRKLHGWEKTGQVKREGERRQTRWIAV